MQSAARTGIQAADDETNTLLGTTASGSPGLFSTQTQNCKTILAGSAIFACLVTIFAAAITTNKYVAIAAGIVTVSAIAIAIGIFADCREKTSAQIQTANP